MKHTKIITARFWVSHNGDYVRLSLRGGDSIELFEGGQTDEGSEATWTMYSRVGNVITCNWDRSERDCDGRRGDSGEYETTVRDLTAAEPTEWNPERPPMPQWRVVDSSQRDYAAESAGY